jgi:hypothetical protein
MANSRHGFEIAKRILVRYLPEWDLNSKVAIDDEAFLQHSVMGNPQGIGLINAQVGDGFLKCFLPFEAWMCPERDLIFWQCDSFRKRQKVRSLWLRTFCCFLFLFLFFIF